jgi:hypothetical protein
MVAGSERHARGRFVRSGLFLALALIFVAGVSAWMAMAATGKWDYSLDAGRPIDALVHLRLHDFLALRPDMGPLSLLLRAPFVALAHLFGSSANNYSPEDYRYWLDDYRWGVFPCAVLAGLFGIWLAREVAARGRGLLACTAIVVIATINPVTLRAIHFGHPEEMLGAALLAGAMLAAILRRAWLAACLLALAIVNKQWAVIGAPAVLVALYASVGWERLKSAALVLAGVMLALIVPVLIVDAGGVYDLTKRMADLRGTYVFPADIWYAISPDLTAERAANSLGGLRDMPDWLGLIARPLIVAMGVVIPLALARRIREDVVGRAFPLLALVMLLRCALDPADNGYYHVPFLLALLGADALSGRFYATALALVFLQIPTTLQPTPEDLNRFYISWAMPFAIYLAGRAYGLDWVALVRSRGARGRAAAPQAHLSSSGASTPPAR